MSYRLIATICVSLALIGCSGSKGDISSTGSPVKSGSTSSVKAKVPVPKELLWDTNLTFGARPAVDSTGVERGEQVYLQNCAICHAEGVGMAGTESLQRYYREIEETELDPVLANRTDLNGPIIESYVRNGVKSMPYFRKTEVSDEDLEVLIEYMTRNNPPEEE